jgi:hypothetical protein
MPSQSEGAGAPRHHGAQTSANPFIYSSAHEPTSPMPWRQRPGGVLGSHFLHIGDYRPLPGMTNATSLSSECADRAEVTGRSGALKRVSHNEAAYRLPPT